LTCLQFEVPAVLHSSLEYELVLIFFEWYSLRSLFIFLNCYICTKLKHLIQFIYFILQRSV
jgi:hypothetical protein